LALRGETAALSRLLAHRPEAALARDAAGYTPLHYAARSLPAPHLCDCRLGGDWEWGRDRDHGGGVVGPAGSCPPPLRRSGHLEAMRLLLDARADPNAVTAAGACRVRGSTPSQTFK